MSDLTEYDLVAHEALAVKRALQNQAQQKNEEPRCGVPGCTNVASQHWWVVKGYVKKHRCDEHRIEVREL